MSPNFSKHRLIKSLAVLAALLAIVAVALPWKFWLEKRLITMFEAQGFQNVHLTVSALGVRGISLKDISVGSNTRLTLEDITIGYSLPELWRGDLRELNIKGLTLQAYHAPDQWTIDGLDNWLNSSNGKANASIPVTFDQLSSIPLVGAKLENSNLHITSNQWQIDIPLQLAWQKLPVPKLTYQAKALTFKMHDLDISTGETSLESILHEDDKKWYGEWRMKDILVQGGAVPIPVMEGKGSLTAHAEDISLLGEFKSADNSYKANFSMEYDLNSSEKSLFTLREAIIPWNSGTLSVHNVRMPLAGKNPTEFNLKVQRVSVDALMQMLTGKRASATGTVSGNIPVTIGTDGGITFHQGSLRAEQPGTIIMAPDAIPGDNEQIVLVRDILKNLHYNMLFIAVNSDKGNKLSVLLTLQGNNPDVYEGRPVKLNVHLTGDMLSLIQQSIMPFMNPQQLLQ
ncbi:MAG: YdbH domain-containing protein [Pseudomonadota bacterium]